MRRVCLVGCGNITNLRHIPALQKLRSRAEIIGVIGADEEAVHRTAKRVNARYSAPTPLNEASFASLPWLNDVELAVIGTPPRSHAELASVCLRNGLNVLVEKPMTVFPAESVALQALATERNRTLAVMHNFQYANGAERLHRVMRAGELGDIRSFFMMQFTSRHRRLPVWYQDLPLGLFFDEASHFIYMLRRLGGPVAVLDAQGQFSADPQDRTPVLMNATMTAGGIPAQLMINFNAPVCEWLFVVSGSKKLACYDFFRDVLTVLPNDRSHLALDVLRTSAFATFGHWAGFVSNGIRLVTGNLHYGIDSVMTQVLDTLDGKPLPEEISPARGIETVETMSQIASLIDASRRRTVGGA